MISRWMFILSLYFSFVVTFGYDKLSRLQKATQSSRNNDSNASPNRAVDGEIDTCSSTGADNPAWWYLDLQEIKSIHHIQIYFKGKDTINEQRQRELMYGYQLYVSNTTDLRRLENSHLCYNNSGPDLPDLTVTHVCISFGRYIIFYNERVPGVAYPTGDDMIENSTRVQLCEVVVNGCELVGKYGKYGQNCFNTCPTHCQEQRCYITNGTCVGCTDGWTGTTCKKPCTEGYYGLECRGICSNNCLNNRTCNHVTGICDNGCSEGWTGGRCNITCTTGTYGPDCSKNCSGNCLNGTSCNKVTGVCENRCTSGYTGEGCDQVCTPGTYGTECTENCSGNCMNGTFCNTVTGNCDEGCSPGYTNDKCDQECPGGRFGLDCMNNCSGNCWNKETCSNVDGRCMHGCKPGFQGVVCENTCTTGTYGADCSKNCSGNCLNGTSCNKVTGVCDNGCTSGYTGVGCNKACMTGTYGVRCSKTCSVNCRNRTSCDKVTGVCDEGCTPGYTVCSKGYHGEDCKLRCSGHCAENDTCYHINGFCLNGCQDRYWGKRCEEHSTDMKEHASDVNETLAGLASVSAISILLNVALIVFLFQWFRRRSKNDCKNAESYESRISPREQGDAHVYQELQHQNSSSQVYQNLS